MLAQMRITPPQTTAYQIVNPITLTISAELNFPSILTASFVDNYLFYANENDSSQPLQQNAYVDYLEDGTHKFRGKIWSIQREILQGIPTVTIVAFDKLQVLNHTLAVYKPASTAYHIWSQYTPSEALSRVQLYKTPYYAGGYRERWMPKYDSAAWLDTGTVETNGQYFVTSGYTITNGDTEIMAQSAAGNPGNLGFPPSGILRINNAGTPSCVAYNGYTYKASDNRWYFNNCDWAEDSGAGSAGLLGSTAANHASGATVHLMTPKRIHFDTRILIEGKEGANYEPIVNTHYRPNFDDGSFIFSSSPLTLQLGAAAYDSIWASYAVFDEDGGSQLDLTALLTSIIEADPADFGPGFGGAYTDTCTRDIQITPALALTRVVVDEPTKAGDFIRGLLGDLGLLRGVSSDAIGMWYDSERDKLCIKTITQAAAGSAARVYQGETRRNVEVSMESVASAVGAMYQTGEGFNLIEYNRIWHTACNDSDATGPSGAVPAVWHKVGNNWQTSVATYPATYDAPQAPNASGGSQVVNTVTDNDSGTGMAILWDNAANAKIGSTQKFYAWFPGVDNQTPDSFYINRVTAVFEVVGESESSTAGFTAHVKYHDDLVPDSTNPYSTAPTSAGGAKFLDSRLTCQFKPGTYNYATVTLEADDLFVLANAISIEIDSPLKTVSDVPSGSGLYGFKLLDLRVEGVQLNFATCQLKGTYASTDAGTLTAAESHAKLVDDTMGQFIVNLIQLGPSTREVALNFCWLQLLQLLALAQAKEYDISSEGIDLGHGPPVLMDTVQFTDDSTGVVDSYTYTVAEGQRALNMRVIDYNTPLFGSAI